MTNLENLQINETPFTEEIGDDLKKEFLIMLDGLQKLKMINEDEVTPEDLEDAKTEKAERIKAAEEAKKEAEEEAARVAAEAADAAKNAEDGEQEEVG